MPSDSASFAGGGRLLRRRLCHLVDLHALETGGLPTLEDLLGSGTPIIALCRVVFHGAASSREARTSPAPAAAEAAKKSRRFKRAFHRNILQNETGQGRGLETQERP